MELGKSYEECINEPNAIEREVAKTFDFTDAYEVNEYGKPKKQKERSRKLNQSKAKEDQRRFPRIGIRYILTVLVGLMMFWMGFQWYYIMIGMFFTYMIISSSV